MGSSHAVVGAAAGAWLAVAVRPVAAIALLGVAVSAAAALTPDVDHLDGSASRAFEMFRFRIGRRVVRIGPGPLASWAVRAVSRLTTGRAHRGLSHSLAFALLVAGLTGGVSAAWVPPSHALHLAAAAGVGVVSALAGDLVTHAGLAHLLWPSRRRISVPRWLRIRTGGVVERWVVLPGALLALAAAAGLALGGGS